MRNIPTSCPKCKGKRIFHIGDVIAFSGDKSYFSLAGLSDSAKIAGLRVHGARDNVVAVICAGHSSSSLSMCEVCAGAVDQSVVRR